MRKELREQWVKAGYESRMGSAEVVPPPPKDFIRAYHLTSAEIAINDISLCRMKVARFSELNDPFELMGLNLREQHIRAVARDFKDAYNTDTGLLCFSSNWISPVLWSHYGDKHRGICLGFNLKRTIAEIVEYEDSRILLNLGEDGNPLKLSDDLQALLRRTKYSHWKYEQEVRTFVPLRDAEREGELYFRHFNKDFQLAEVILGSQCTLSPDAERQLTRSLHPDAVVFKARLAFKHFAIVPDKRSLRGG